MIKTHKIAVLYTIIALTLTLPLAAQFVQNGPGSLESNTKKATAGIFSNEVDDYIDTRNWSGVKFDKWFGFMSGMRNPGTNNTQLWGAGTGNYYLGSIGYATKIGGIYLGTWYNGNILALTGTTTVTETIEAEDDPLSQIQTKVTTTTSYNDAWFNTSNQLQVLIGVANMGFKLGFFESIAKDRNPAMSGQDIEVIDYQDGTVKYTNAVVDFERDGGHIRPALGWGMSMKAGSMTLKPYVDLALDFYKKETIDNSRNYTTVLGQEVGESETTREGNISRYLRPDIALGADVVLSPFTIGLKYGIKFTAYNSNYDASVLSGDVPGTVSWSNSSYKVKETWDTWDTTDTAKLTFKEMSDQTHTITPSFKVTGEPAGGLKLGLKLSVPVSVGISKDDNYTETKTVETVRHKASGNLANDTTTTTIVRTKDGLNETTTFDIKPEIGLGATYKLVPDRFTINAGVFSKPIAYAQNITKTSPNGVKSITTSTTTDGYGVVTADMVTNINTQYEDDSVKYTPTWTPFAAEVRAGFRLDFAPQFFMDFQAGIGGSIGAGASDFSFNLAELNVLFAIRF